MMKLEIVELKGEMESFEILHRVDVEMLEVAILGDFLVDIFFPDADENFIFSKSVLDSLEANLFSNFVCAVNVINVDLLGHSVTTDLCDCHHKWIVRAYHVNCVASRVDDVETSPGGLQPSVSDVIETMYGVLGGWILWREERVKVVVVVAYLSVTERQFTHPINA